MFRTGLRCLKQMSQRTSSWNIYWKVEKCLKNVFVNVKEIIFRHYLLTFLIILSIYLLRAVSKSSENSTFFPVETSNNGLRKIYFPAHPARIGRTIWLFRKQIVLSGTKLQLCRFFITDERSNYWQIIKRKSEGKSFRRQYDLGSNYLHRKNAWSRYEEL